eukprot:TRINITY_DN9806_c0_g4_i1.p1 TRINITY_DN9806_c0_g4~~TRINITY_DN9806_c0_g4_i1.p1  ORF type:complete len:484 (+),score=115.52 TRINITY_DN9806_c0_g4_i1:30-1454(+)
MAQNRLLWYTLALLPFCVAVSAYNLHKEPSFAAQPKFQLVRTPGPLHEAVAANFSAICDEQGDHVVNVLDYGADPTGFNDSSAALQAAFDHATSLLKDTTIGASNILVNLQAGHYSLSKGLLLTKKSIGFVIAGGSLTARDNFNNDDFLITCAGCTNMMFHDLILDNRHRGGGMRFADNLQTQVVDVFFAHFNTTGLDGNTTTSHELLISGCFFEEFHWNEPGYNNSKATSAIAINLGQPDSHILNTIIRCAKKGIVAGSNSNMISGAHVYTSCDWTGNDMTIGFEIQCGIRLVESYIDNCYLSFLRPDCASTVTGNMFFGQGQAHISPTQPKASWQSMVMRDNLFDATPDAKPTIVLNETNGNSIDPSQTFSITLENFHAPGTVARFTTNFAALPFNSTMDLSAQLLIVPADAVVRCSVLMDAPTGGMMAVPACMDVAVCSAQRTGKMGVFEVRARSLSGPGQCSGSVTLTVE